MILGCVRVNMLAKFVCVPPCEPEFCSSKFGCQLLGPETDPEETRFSDRGIRVVRGWDGGGTIHSVVQGAGVGQVSH